MIFGGSNQKRVQGVYCMGMRALQFRMRGPSRTT
jgi:hypothetical protein